MSSTDVPTQFLPEFEFARAGHSYTRPVIWSLWSDGVHLAAPGEPERCRAYATLTTIRLYKVPVKNAESVFHCAITFQDGQTLDFINYKTTGPDQFELQNAGYRAFAEVLLQQASLHAPGCRVMSGQEPGLYMAAKVAAIVLAPCFLAYLYAAWQRNDFSHALVNVVLIMTPLLGILSSAPKPLAPAAISSQLPAS